MTISVQYSLDSLVSRLCKPLGISGGISTAAFESALYAELERRWPGAKIVVSRGETEQYTGADGIQEIVEEVFFKTFSRRNANG
jgi:hypothetical protein